MQYPNKTLHLGHKRAQVGIKTCLHTLVIKMIKNKIKQTNNNKKRLRGAHSKFRFPSSPIESKSFWYFAKLDEFPQVSCMGLRHVKYASYALQRYNSN